MGTIIASKIMPDNMIKFTVQMDQEEALWLAGRMKHIHMFTEEVCEVDASIIEKGKDGVAKYFMIPKVLRSREHKKLTNFVCQLLETDVRAIYIYISDKPGTHQDLLE